MALNHGNSLVKDKLVFSYDMGNTSKSWKGKPIVNLITNPLPDGTSTGFTKSGGSGVVSYDEKYKAIKWVQTTWEVWGAYMNIQPPFTDTLDINSQYTISFEWKIENPEIAPNAYGWELVQGNGQSVAGLANMLNNSVNIGDRWYYFSYTFTPANAGVGSAYNRIKMNNNGTYVSTFFIRKVQFEKNTFASPFVVGERTNTNSIIDLNSSTTLTATDLQYNSDNTFEYTGISKLIFNKTRTTMFTHPNVYSFEIILKRNGVNTSSAIIIGAQGYNTGFLCTTGGNLTVSQWYDNGGAWAYWGTPSIFLTDNTYYHAIYTFDAYSDCRVYINGELRSTSNTLTYTTTSNNNWYGATSWLCVGGYSYLPYCFIGTVPVARMYDGILTASQVKQNYNALKKRFGI